MVTFDGDHMMQSQEESADVSVGGGSAGELWALVYFKTEPAVTPKAAQDIKITRVTLIEHQ